MPRIQIEHVPALFAIFRGKPEKGLRVFSIVEDMMNIRYRTIKSYMIEDQSFSMLDLFPGNHPSDQCNTDFLKETVIPEGMRGCLLVLYMPEDREHFSVTISMTDGGKESLMVENKSNGSMGAAVAIVAILLVVLVLIGITMWKLSDTTTKYWQIAMDRLKNGPPAPSCNYDLVNTSVPEVPGKAMSYTEILSLVKKHNFKQEIQEEYERLQNDDQSKIGLVKSTSIGRMGSDLELNRYGNILPYDDTRVILSSKVDGTDYINASWIRGYRDSKFIATQGPTPKTCTHFWQMIFENNCQIIIMLTKLKEKQKNNRTGKV